MGKLPTHPDNHQVTQKLPPVTDASTPGQVPLPGSRPQFKVRNIGIHGARSTGKTCYLACCLYGHSVTEDVAVVLGDNPSVDSLMDAWDLLMKGELPRANAVVIPDEVKFSLHTGGVRWTFGTVRHSGL